VKVSEGEAASVAIRRGVLQRTAAEEQNQRGETNILSATKHSVDG
jgi:hypothetical protein